MLCFLPLYALYVSPLIPAPRGRVKLELISRLSGLSDTGPEGPEFED